MKKHKALLKVLSLSALVVVGTLSNVLIAHPPTEWPGVKFSQPQQSNLSYKHNQLFGIPQNGG